MKKSFKIYIFFSLFFAIVLTSFPSPNIVKASSSQVKQNNYLMNTNPTFPFVFKKSGFLDISYNLTISKGKANYYASTIPLIGGNYSTISMKLQRYKNGSWNTINSGTAKGKGSQLFYGTYYISKGYKYRATATLKIYKSKGGKLISSANINTATRKY
ncbi:hypothetical protein [Anaerostipes sp.]|uniref:hypothetical protein n=1 Tax=Anaerostipes sp. TaxID=1872530 RepID=UPI0025BA87C2|nr:hypothetical protein [Anaerostipes sp.]MBS7009523.1 hypothetical protein [Anaerostipes sp.]